MAGRIYAALFHDYLREMKALSDAEFGRLCRALLQYSKDGTPMALSGNERFYAERVMMREDDAKASYSATSSARSEAGRTGAARRWQNMANDNSEWQNIANDDKNANMNMNPTKEKEVSPNGDTKKEKAKSGRFVPPTIEEVRAYCEERGGKVDPERWYAYYQSNGWRVGRSSMKDWKASVRLWESYDSRPSDSREPAAVSFDVNEFFADAVRNSYKEG